ncbi:uncharacterized protein LOC131020555 [Salvia miltiorrhiza]|uniref:uncharacterized protein LOC131020555 n=1 Tax=Salvia miltiorrhiza TaxID=226208 RepID=UPI0025AC5C63|nr:uncharacterized protein LOC131020555 [Salvia miltiorrhiza]
MWGSILRRVISHSHQQSRRLSGGPWLMLPPARSGNTAAYNLYSPVKGQVVSFNINGNDETVEVMQDPATRLVGSSHGWLALFNPRRRVFFLSNPLSGCRIDLPHPPTDFIVPPLKVIVSSSSPDDDDCRALMMFDSDAYSYVCRPGRSAWTLFGKFAYEDFVYSAARKRFLCVLQDQFMHDSDDEELEPWDLECWNVVQEPEPTIDWKVETLDSDFLHKQMREVSFRFKRYMRYLVADAYVVTRYFNWYKKYEKTVGFDVHRIGKGVASRYMEGSLDGLVMFVGVNESFAVAASEFPELQPDSIYYTHNSFYDDGDVYGGHDLGIFDYRNKTWSPCYYPCDPSSFKKIHPPPIWYTPNAPLYN